MMSCHPHISSPPFDDAVPMQVEFDYMVILEGAASYTLRSVIVYVPGPRHYVSYVRIDDASSAGHSKWMFYNDACDPVEVRAGLGTSVLSSI